MAKVLHRMFHRDRKSGFNAESPESLTSYKCWKPPEFDPKQIRLLVYQETDIKGKKLLFDSKAIKKVEECCKGRKYECSSIRSKFYAPTPNGKCSTGLPRNSSNPCLDNGENGKYQFVKPGSDAKMLGEMMFGSVAINYRGSTLKVHTLRYLPQLMLTRIFILKPVKDSQLDHDSIERDNVSLNSSLQDISTTLKNIDVSTKHQSLEAQSLPIFIPNSPSSTKDAESGIAGMSGSSSSFYTPFPSPCSSVSSTSSNSFSRRLMRSQTMRMDINLGRRRSSMDNPSSSQDEPVARRRNPKIGLAVVIGLGKDGRDDEQANKFERFFFSHFSLFESHFQKLKQTVEKALTLQRKTYLTPLVEGLEDFRNAIFNLYTAPRIQKPIWLDLMSYPSQRGHLCHHFLKELMTELEQHNTANTSFFVSCLLTAVLTHHLAWVPTVMPAGVTPNRAYLDKHSSTFLDTLAKSHPYNPLWAQLGDLYGSIGYPVNIAKTVVVGKKSEVVCRLLFILSYFIRCSEVYEKHEVREEIPMEYKPIISFDDVAEFVTMPSEQEVEWSNGRSTSDETPIRNGALNAVATGNESNASSRAEGSGYQSSAESNDLETDFHDSSILLGRSNFCSLKAKKQDSGIASSMEHSLDCFDHPTSAFEVQWEQNNSNAKLKRVAQERRFILGATDESSSSDCSKQPSPIVNRKLTDSLTETLVAVQSADTTGDSLDPVCNNLVRTNDDIPLQAKCERVVAVGRIPPRTETSVYKKYLNPIESLKTGYVPPPNSLSKSTIPQVSCEKLYPDLSNAVNSGNVIEVDIPMVDHSNMLSQQDAGSCVTDSIKHIEGVACVNDATLDRETNENASGNSTPTLEKFKDVNSLLTAETPTTPKVHLHRSYSENCGFDPRLVKRGISEMSNSSVLSKQSTLSHGSYDNDILDPEELPFCPSVCIDDQIAPQCSHLENFGRSLLGGYSPNYMPDFALQGVLDLDKEKVKNDVKLNTQTSVLDEPIAGSVCIVADTDKWSVELYSSDIAVENRPPSIVPRSKLVSNLLQSIQELWQMKLAPDFCLMHLEDRLQEIYFKSTLLTDYLKTCEASIEELQTRLAIDQSDILLLLSVSGVHSSHVIYERLYKSLSFTNQQQVVDTPSTDTSTS
ncbi:folliculin-interacting protein 1-like isoform X2 [Anneissia japonica]|uniref:folliculin-interacting protein 1-like isoform X2 n=1 Tax=Anneissia japonica TaxID=1529436 RepID=UPI001425887C|nr:folliculin-interacting protein 1-like isoform X2 [Anneissia japonica]